MRKAGNSIPEDEQNPEPIPANTTLTSNAISRIERKFKIIIEHEGIAIPDDLNPRVLCSAAKEMLRNRDKIGAIQVQREQTGAGFGEAKKLVDESMEQIDE